MKRGLTFAAALLLGGAESAWAHPGHGLGGTVESVAHWLTSPDHAVAVIAVILVAGMGAGLRRMRSRSH